MILPLTLDTSPNQSGFHPDLSLSYNSGNGGRTVRFRMRSFAPYGLTQDRQGIALLQ